MNKLGCGEKELENFDPEAARNSIKKIKCDFGKLVKSQIERIEKESLKENTRNEVNKKRHENENDSSSGSESACSTTACKTKNSCRSKLKTISSSKQDLIEKPAPDVIEYGESPIIKPTSAIKPRVEAYVNPRRIQQPPTIINEEQPKKFQALNDVLDKFPSNEVQKSGIEMEDDKKYSTMKLKVSGKNRTMVISSTLIPSKKNSKKIGVVHPFKTDDESESSESTENKIISQEYILNDVKLIENKEKTEDSNAISSFSGIGLKKDIKIETRTQNLIREQPRNFTLTVFLMLLFMSSCVFIIFSAFYMTLNWCTCFDRFFAHLVPKGFVPY